MSPRTRTNEAKGADTRARIVVAMLAGARTFPALCAATGLSKQPIHRHLCMLREQGIVDWEPGKVGTLHLLVRPVPFG